MNKKKKETSKIKIKNDDLFDDDGWKQQQQQYKSFEHFFFLSLLTALKSNLWSIIEFDTNNWQIFRDKTHTQMKTKQKIKWFLNEWINKCLTEWLTDIKW